MKSIFTVTVFATLLITTGCGAGLSREQVNECKERLASQLGTCSENLAQEFSVLDDCKNQCIVTAANVIDQCLIDYQFDPAAYRVCVDAAEADEQDCIADCGAAAEALEHLESCLEGSVAAMDECTSQ